MAKKEGLSIKDAAVFIAKNIRKQDASDFKAEHPVATFPAKTFRQVARIVITVEVEP